MNADLRKQLDAASPELRLKRLEHLVDFQRRQFDALVTFIAEDVRGYGPIEWDDDEQCWVERVVADAR